MIIIILTLIFISMIISVYLLYNKQSLKESLKESYGCIPKILHQTYSIYENIPDDIRKTMLKLKKKNPDWQYKFYDDNDIFNYLSKNFPPKVLKAYLKINPKYGPARADLFRYAVLYNEGGVYLDAKSFCNKPLSKVIKSTDKFVLSYWHNYKPHADLIGLEKGEIINWFIAVIPKHPLMLKVINAVVDNINNPKFKDATGKYNVLLITGPVVFTNILKMQLYLYPHRLVDNYTSLYLDYSHYNNHVHITKNHYTTLKDPIILN